MEPEQIKAILEQSLNLEEVLVKGDGSHFEVIAVSDMFEGMSRVAKQRTIYTPLMEYFSSNAIHALSIKALTPVEWARDKKLMQLM